MFCNTQVSFIIYKTSHNTTLSSIFYSHMFASHLASSTSGMCKRHWKAANFPPEDKSSKAKAKAKLEEPPPAPHGDSVYDNILPTSISYRPMPPKNGEDPLYMPLVTFLQQGAEKYAPGWHRSHERAARGLHAVSSLSVQLEPWERQLVRMLYVCPMYMYMYQIVCSLCFDSSAALTLFVPSGCCCYYYDRPWWKFFS